MTPGQASRISARLAAAVERDPNLRRNLLRLQRRLEQVITNGSHCDHLVILAELVQAEFRRLGHEVPVTKTSLWDGGKGPLAVLRERGRELDTSTPVYGACDDRQGRIVATLDRVAILEYGDGSRVAVGAHRLLVDPAQVSFRDLEQQGPHHHYRKWSMTTPDEESKARGRAHALAGRTKRKTPAAAATGA